MNNLKLLMVRHWHFCLIAIFSICFLKKGLQLILHPRLWAEEGVIYLKSAIDIGWKSLLMPQVGYYSLIPSVTFYLSTLINAKFIPWLSEGISALFWFILLFQILNLDESKYAPKFKICLIISVFAVIFGQPEVFLNTINLQFICPAIVLCLYLSWRSDKSQFKKIIDHILLMVCLLNGILCFFILPFALFKDIKTKNYLRISLWFLAFSIHIFMIYKFAGNSSLQWRLGQNINLSVQELNSGIVSYLYNRKYWFILLGLIFFITYYLKNLNVKSELIILALSILGLTVFLELTKQPHASFLHSRYLVVVNSLIVFNMFLFLNESTINNTVLMVIISAVLIYYNSKKIFASEICTECPSWNSQYPKLYLKNSDVQVHPMYKKNKPWSFNYNPYILNE